MWTDNLMRLIKTSTASDVRASAPSSVAVNSSGGMQKPEISVVIWWGLALSILCSNITRFSAETSGIFYYTAVVLGSGGCAWLWLLSRGLFRSKKDLHSGMIYVVPMIIAIEAIAALLSSNGTAGLGGEVGRVFINAASMVCIASIAFIYSDTLYGYSKLRSAPERRFRLIYMGSFSLVVAVAVLWMWGAGSDTLAAQWRDTVLTACGVVALIASRMAVQYRLNNPQHTVKPTAAEKAATETLSQRILKAINDDNVLTTANLKVADFADQLKEQEYKVTRCITNHLQYRNFNHLLNSHRIDRAKRLFTDQHSSHLTIATIAYDCGFNSLGPFNRAFKQFTGLTPRAFRQQQLSD